MLVQTRSFLSLERDEDRKEVFVSQHSEDLTACGPLAIFYSFLIKDSIFHGLTGKIPGRNAPEKFQSFQKSFFCQPSSQHSKSRWSPGQKLFYRDAAPAVRDALAILSDSERVPTVYGSSLERCDGEDGAHFLERIHQLIVASLRLDVPVIAFLQSYCSDYDPQNDTNFWSNVDGHVICITGIQEWQPEKYGNLMIQFRDPADGRSYEGFFFEEVYRDFTAQKFLPETKESIWLETTTRSPLGYPVLSPYLNFHSSVVDMYLPSAPLGSRYVYTLEFTCAAAIKDNAVNKLKSKIR